MEGGEPESFPTTPDNIRSLNFSSMSLCKIEEVSGAVYLIMSCPKLQDLTIEFDPVVVEDIIEPVVEFLRCQSFSLYAEKLQKVHVNLFMGLEMEMEFMKFILASAPVLKEIFIWNFSYLLHRSNKQMMDEMKEIRRASPNVEFVLNKSSWKIAVNPKKSWKCHGFA